MTSARKRKNKHKSSSGAIRDARDNSHAIRNIDSVVQLEEKAVKDRSYGERIAEVATRAAGSTPSVLLHTLFFAAWVVLNIGVVPRIPAFDPFPFNFLTMLVSIEVIFLTLLVLLTQQRIIREADKRAHLDLQLSMLAEQEGTIVLRTLQRITQHLGMKDEADLEARELQERTNVSQLARKLEKELPG
jgi:uncharacterized membrane protein